MRRALLCVPQFGVLCGVLLLAACADTAESSSSRIEQESESEAASESTLDRTQQETEQGEANFPFDDARSFSEGLAAVKVGDSTDSSTSRANTSSTLSSMGRGPSPKASRE